ncbi:ATP cone domain-containing protein [Clostridium septicum]|uniref:ATP cone domain-containing protein n=1 Tax=Clostridium septicum TaxID=1504 RepID=A0A9N7PKL0_CLOSE|nr:ATP cone domain-containing protein [Clostridium septicum]AYE35775.1 hypothetical protein CP523_15760 [Clostridium septicum]MDU1315094.1 ATP cone domain-containing protein [Clostridium septicum]QAS61113.1 hypothetical protein EI377_10475 [Clostridium septicum]UEC19550.1 hypothetical protein LK444_08935 [Clostridium septicum]USS02391.1 ATP cone domain-containing protein [Clostridium septicum]
MEILKKNGKKEEFSSKKLITSIENAGRDADTILNESDLNMLKKDIIKTLEQIREKTEITSSYEIIGVVIDTLKKEGFRNIIKTYIRYDK